MQPATLLTIWERGEGEGMGRRALTLLAGAPPGTAADALALLPVGRPDALLIELRERLFGSRFAGLTTCPACAREVELSFETAEVRRETTRAGTATVAAGGIEVDVRLPNGGDLAAIETIRDVGAARELLLHRCIVAARRGCE